MNSQVQRQCRHAVSAHRPTRHLTLVGEGRVTSLGQRYTTIRNWRLLRTYLGTLHLVGHIGQCKEVWATPPLIRIDSTLRVAIARNGMRYLMLGEPGAPSIAGHLVSLSGVFDERLLVTEDVTHGLTNRLHTVALYLDSLVALQARKSPKSQKNPLDFSS